MVRFMGQTVRVYRLGQFIWGRLGPTFLVCFAVAAYFAARDVVGARPFVFLVPAVLLGSLWGRFWPGVLSVSIATVAGAYLIPTSVVSALDSMSEWTIVAVFFASGLLANYFSSQLRKSRARESALEKRLSRLVESNIVGIVSWHVEGGIFDANDVFLQMIGYSRDELERGAVDWRKLTPAEWGEVDARALAELRARGAHQPYEKEYVRKDGTRIPIIVGAAHLPGSSAEGISFILDISEQKKVREELSRAVRVRDEFLSIASHELKTPLTSLLLQSDILLRKLGRNDVDTYSPEHVQRLAEQTRKQIDRLRKLIEDMLDASSIQSGHLSVNATPVDLCEIVREVAGLLSPAAAAANTVIRLDLPAHPVVGAWDGFRLEQVITNLLTNAVRYGAAKPVVVTVKASALRVILSVADQGNGIAPEDVERIFNRFERASSDAATAGLGLGLYISRVVVTLHGGRIWAESAGKGQGSVFHVELPLTQALEPLPEPEPV